MYPYARYPVSPQPAALRNRVIDAFVNAVPPPTVMPQNVVAFPGVALERDYASGLGRQIVAVLIATLAINLLIVVLYAGIL